MVQYNCVSTCESASNMYTMHMWTHICWFQEQCQVLLAMHRSIWLVLWMRTVAVMFLGRSFFRGCCSTLPRLWKRVSGKMNSIMRAGNRALVCKL